jgi:hypothetical protein
LPAHAAGGFSQEYLGGEMTLPGYQSQNVSGAEQLIGPQLKLLPPLPAFPPPMPPRPLAPA